MLAGDQLGQIRLLLPVAAVAADLVDAEVGMRAVGQADRGRSARDLLHRDAMLEIAQARAAILLLDGDAEQAERADLRPQVAREIGCSRSISAARGAISFCENACTVSRIASAVSPRSKLNILLALGIMAASRRIRALFQTAL